MTLNDEIDAVMLDAHKGQIERVIKQLSGDDLADFINALNNHAIPAPALCRAMSNRGYEIDPRRINEYRNNKFKHYGIDGKRVT